MRRFHVGRIVVAAMAVACAASTVSTLAAEKDPLRDGDGKLRHALVMRDSQGGFAGFSGWIWTIEADGRWRREPFLNKTVRKADRTGKLDAKGLAALAAEMDRLKLLDLPRQLGGKAMVNPHVVTIGFGTFESKLVLGTGAPLPKADDKPTTPTARFVAIVRYVQENLVVK